MSGGLKNPVIALVLAATVVSASGNALAGRSCQPHRIQVEELKSAVAVATEVRSFLNHSAATYALIARVGDDVSDHGLKYTHMGIVRKRVADDEWEIVHQLNHCMSTRSGLYAHGLGNFMLDDLYSHDVLLLTLKAPMQEHLARVFAVNLPQKIYEPEYSMISNPGVPAKYQNSNQWILEILAQAQADRRGRTLDERSETHAFYRESGYHGSEIRISGFRRAMASLASGNVRFDDHPESARESGRYEVVSVASIRAYLSKTGDLAEAVEIKGTYRRKDRIPGRSPQER